MNINIKKLIVLVIIAGMQSNFGMQVDPKHLTKKQVKQIVRDAEFKRECELYGNTDVSEQTRKYVHDALRLMGKKNPEKVPVKYFEKERDGFDGKATLSGVWLSRGKAYEIHFLAFHEAGHKAKKHPSCDFEIDTRKDKEGQDIIYVTPQARCKLDKRQKEKEADITAIDALLEAGDGDTVARAYLNYVRSRPILARKDDGISYPDARVRACYMKDHIISCLEKSAIEPKKLSLAEKINVILCDQAGENAQAIRTWSYGICGYLVGASIICSIGKFLKCPQQEMNRAFGITALVGVSSISAFSLYRWSPVMREKLWLTQVGLLDPKRREEQLKTVR